jgi:hypothetical protein
MSTENIIPVKCPGCQAGFDVPTHLAGKTIRCTSCKTQLPVPTPGAKASPAASAANGKPKSIGDLLPTAKTSPKAASGPAPESAADALPKGGKPNRRRDDDDDEDDEDDDDRPARGKKGKKAASGGGVPVPLIIGLVGVLVLGGAGVGAYFVFAKDKPAETAATTTGDGATTPTPGRPAGADGDLPSRRGNEAGPGPTGTGTERRAPGTVATDGWVTHKGDGFTIDFPAGVRPEKKSMGGPGGVGLSILADPSAKEKGGYLVLTMALPPEVKALQPKALLDMIVGQMESGKSGPLGSGGKVAVANKVETEVDGFPAYDLTLTPNGKNLDVFARIVAVNGKIVMVICGHDTDPTFASNAPRFRGSLRIDPDAAVASGPPATFPMGGPLAVRPMPMNPGVGSPPDRGMPPDRGGPGDVAPMPAFPMPGENPMPGVGATTPPPAFPPPGGEPAFPPPGGNPAFPPPGGETTPGGAPVFGGAGGGYVVPALAGRVEPFFAIAFDAEKGEVYTVAPRPISGTKTGGTLRRYSYPDFLPKGQWKITRMATRATIDPVNGKLYLASVTAPNAALAALKNDRATATGDVDVFDLGAIRTGKAEEGSELKTAAIFSAASPIRGLDVSPDGKTLTILVSRQPASGKSGKATLRQYDTAERKLIREKDLPNPAWDMTRSADGKMFLITEFPLNDRQALLAYDPATLAPKTLTLPAGIVSDIAPGPDGKLVVAVGAVGGKAGKLVLVDPTTGLPTEIPTVEGRASQNGYVRFTPDGKRLLVASHGYGPNGSVPGVDVFDVSDAGTPTGYKKAATVRSAGMIYVGGHFHIGPDGQRVVFQTGAVLATDKMTEHVGGPEPAGVNGGGGAPGFGVPGGGEGLPGAAPPGFPAPGGGGFPMPGAPAGFPMPGAPAGFPMPGPPGGLRPPMGIPQPGGVQPPMGFPQPGGVQPPAGFPGPMGGGVRPPAGFPQPGGIQVPGAIPAPPVPMGEGGVRPPRG